MSVADTLNERSRTHGSYAEHATTAQFIKQMLRAAPRWRELTLPQQESMELICMKLSRIVHGNPHEPDHWRDISGYAELIVRELDKSNG